MSILRHYYWLLLLLLGCAPYKKYDLKDVRERWEKDIKRFEAIGTSDCPSESPVLFYGSSSIRMWETIAEDLAPIPTVRRGYGGATLHDAAYYAKRVLQPIPYKAMALFVANDIWGGTYDKSPKEIVQLVDYIVNTSFRNRPNAAVFLIEITHCPSRNHLIEQWDAANAALQAYAAANDNVYFIPTRDIFIASDGLSNPALFRDDRLHLNSFGYAQWSQRIKQSLEQVLKP